MSDNSINSSAATAAALPPSVVTWLDLLRAISAQCVLLGHLELLHRFERGPFWLPPLQSLAVVIFYLLSGFLITRTLWLRYRDPRYDFGQFFIERFCRIYPAYLASLLFVAGIDYYHRSYFPGHYHAFLNGWGELSYDWPNFITTGLMLCKAPLLGLPIDWHHFLIFGSASQFWSLPPEWWLYLTVGYVALTLKGGGFNLRNYFVLLIFAYIPFFFLFQGNPSTGDGMSAVWLMGGLACILHNLCRVDMQQAHVRRLIVFAAAILTLTTIFRYQIAADPYDALAAFNLAALFLMTIWLVQHRWGDFLALRHMQSLARFLASYSYSLYLTHYSLVGFLNNYALHPSVSWLLCNLLALGFAYFFEMPHRRWATKINDLRIRRLTS